MGAGRNWPGRSWQCAPNVLRVQAEVGNVLHIVRVQTEVGSVLRVLRVQAEAGQAEVGNT